MRTYNLKKIIKILFLNSIIIGLLFTGSCVKDNTINDIDGNVYNTIKIGSQIWMVENLKTTRYSNGDSIPNVLDSLQWCNLTQGAFCNYNNEIEKSKDYGHLYNWYVINDRRGIAPKGWHIPTDEDWINLMNFLAKKSGDGYLIGDLLKESDNKHWNCLNINATNESGFTALPGGKRNESAIFGNLETAGTWWTSVELGANDAWCYVIACEMRQIFRGHSNKHTGLSIRCIKD